VGLDPSAYGRRYPAQLSGGERQRVGVARALAADPPIMLMDEPFGAVDPIVRERLQNEFLRLQETLAKTILFVTHDIDEAIKMGDVVAVFRDGGILEQFGTPAEILAAPASDFVARFVGADRGLKRLSLSRVSDLQLGPAVSARIGDDAGEAGSRVRADTFPYLLLLDEANRPVGWVDDDDIPASGRLAAALATVTSPLFDRRTTLKDALSMLLDDDVQAGVVVDRHGAFRGLVTAQQVMAFMRDTARESQQRVDGSTGDRPAAHPMRERALEVAAIEAAADDGALEAADDDGALGVSALESRGPGSPDR
jgi:osmoprotectant transport system ATP-binding protein